MSWLPDAVVEAIEAALVTEMTVVRRDGRPVTYPLIPLWDGDRVMMTSSILFSRKLEHIKADPRVALSFSDPRFPRYPPLPVLACPGFTPRSPLTNGSGSMGPSRSA